MERYPFVVVGPPPVGQQMDVGKSQGARPLLWRIVIELMGRQTTRRALNASEIEERAKELLDKGMMLYQVRPGEAIGLFSEALRITSKGKDRKLIARATVLIGICHEALSNYQHALDSYAKALKIYRNLGIVDNEGVILYNVGVTYNRMGRFDDAVNIFSQALKIQEGLGNKKKIKLILGPLGRSYAETGQYGVAIDVMTRWLRMCEELEDDAGAISARTTAANIYSDITDEVGDVQFRSGEMVYVTGGDNFSAGRALAGVGEVTMQLGRFDEAIEYAQKSLAMNREIGSRYGEVSALSIMGKTYMEKGDLESARRCCSEALAIVDDIGPVDELVALLRTMGHIHNSAGDMRNALQYYHRALSVSEQMNSRRLQPKIHGLLSDVYERLGDIPKAYEHYKRGMTLKSDMGVQGARQVIARLQSVMQKERAEREKDTALMRASQLELEIMHKERELAAMALNIRVRDDIMEALRANLDALTAGAEVDAKKILNDFLGDLQKEKAAQTSHAFQSEIDRNKDELNKNLSQRFPRLTAAELRICALLRGNMSTKEIADLLCVTTRNVETHRYHIRQKMRLPKDASLITFLASL